MLHHGVERVYGIFARESVSAPSRGGTAVRARQVEAAVVSGNRIDRLRDALTAAFAPQRLEVVDDSHHHAGHAGAASGKGHFSVTIVSDAFAGHTMVKRHRLVYAAVAPLLETDIHALSIDARVPGE